MYISNVLSNASLSQNLIWTKYRWECFKPLLCNSSRVKELFMHSIPPGKPSWKFMLISNLMVSLNKLKVTENMHCQNCIPNFTQKLGLYFSCANNVHNLPLGMIMLPVITRLPSSCFLPSILMASNKSITYSPYKTDQAKCHLAFLPREAKHSPGTWLQ